MVYKDGDNNLESYAIEDFLEMAQVGSDNNVNIVVQFDRINGYATDYDNWTSTKRFLITAGMTPTSANAVMDIGEQNMGDPTVLKDFIQWSVTNYPAEKYALVIWNHGGGWRAADQNRKTLRAVAWDDTSSSDCLYMSEVRQAIAATGTHINLIGFDACLMGMLEVGYALRGLCDVMTGSEEVEPADGWPYHTILSELADNPQMTATELGATVVSKYGAYFGVDSECTQSAINISVLSDLITKVDTFADSMNWATGDSQWTKVTVARNNCSSYYYGWTNFIDLYRFCDQVKQSVTDTTVQTNADAVKTAINNTVIANYAGTYLNDDAGYGSHGIAIYFPQTSSDYTSDGDYPGYEESNTSYPVDYVNDHTWDNFLQRFYSDYTPPTDTFEPNDSLSQAYGFLVSGTQYASYIYTSNDVDYYKINVTTTGVINIDLTSLPGDYDLYLLNSSGGEIASSKNWGTYSESISYTASTLGTYYLKILGYYGACSNSDSYILKATIPTSVPADSTPPTGAPGKPAANESISADNSITFTWTQGSVADTESGIVSYYLQVSTNTSFSTFMYNGDIGNLLTKKISSCTQGLTYYARVRAKNGVGLYSEWSETSSGVQIDITPPIIGEIRDGLSADVDVANSSTTVSANWDTAQDDESSVSKYYYAIGTKPGSRDIVDWSDNGTALSMTHTGLSLQTSTTYYITVKAENAAGLTSASYYQEKNSSNTFIGAGTAQNWKEDDKSWSYTLPFPFNFYGLEYSTVFIDSNGYLDFMASSSSYANSTNTLKDNVRIAPLWDALTTAGSAQSGEDIYLHQPDTSSVCIRWRAETESGAHPVNVEVILYENGKILFNYGTGNENITPTVGISKGDNYNYILSSLDASSSLAAASSIEFSLICSNGQVPFSNPIGKPSKPVPTKQYANSPCVSFTWEKGTLDDTVCSYNIQISTQPDFAAYTSEQFPVAISTVTFTECANCTTYYARIRGKSNADLYSDWSGTSDPVIVDLSTPTCSVSITPVSPLKTGNVAITLTVSDANPILQTPQLKCLLPGQNTATDITLTGENKTWAGTLFIESTLTDGTATFSALCTDSAGNYGTNITSGTTFTIDKRIKAVDGGTTVNADGTALELPFNTLDDNTFLNVTITRPDTNSELIAGAFEKTTHDKSVKKIATENTVRTFTVKNSATGEEISFINGAAIITIPYTDANQDGYVDNTDIAENTLRIFSLEETQKRWILESDIQRNTTKNTVSCSVNHLSTFCVLSYLETATDSLDSVYGYPNPCYPGKGQQFTIVNLPIDTTTIHIYTLTGELIRTLDEYAEIQLNTMTATAVWDLKNEAAEEVASGIYFYTIKTSSSLKKGQPIAVIK